MSTFVLRIIALVAMFMDHLGYRFFYSMPWLRYVGRIAFPLYCFLIAEGLFHTRNRTRYALRLLLLAVISEVPFDLFSSLKVWSLSSQNVFITLLLGLLAAWIVDATWRRMPILSALGVAACAVASYYLKTDYAVYGVCLIVVFYFTRFHKLAQTAGFGLTAAANVIWKLNTGWSKNWTYAQLYGLGALVPILLYNGKPGPKKLQWVFYFFYPAHLLILWAIYKFAR